MRLARMLTPASSTGRLAIFMFSAVQVARRTGDRAAGPAAGRLQMVKPHCDLMETWPNGCSCGARPLSGSVRFLDYIGLLEPVVSFGSAVLEAKFDRGSISVSVEDVLAFGLTVWPPTCCPLSYASLLQEELYPPPGIALGLSYAYSRLVHYVHPGRRVPGRLGGAGMDLSKVSAARRRLRVGIGFGLQDVVNNFVMLADPALRAPVT